MHSAIARIRRTSAWTKPWMRCAGCMQIARTSRTSATIWRTQRPMRGCRPESNWHMMGSCWRSPDERLDRAERAAFLFLPMDVIHFPEDPRPSRWSAPVLALGNFDGLHRGHRKILERVRRVASERGATAVVMTFDPHPPRVVRPDKAPPLLMTKAQKLEALDEAGVQGAAIVRFTEALSRWEPETFVRAVLVDWLHVSEVWVGANFLFGHDRAGNFSLLRSLGARYGFK